jgi:hypothetical protein
VSDVPTGAAGASGPGQVPGDEPTEEEVRAYLGQLRAAPVDQVVAEVASALLNAAQVKLGRRDGRLLIDLVAALSERTRGRLPAELTDQLDGVVAQLQLAQVEAEREVAAAKDQGHDEPDDLPETVGSGDVPGGAGQDQAASQPPPDQPSAASRLWVPGR